MVQPDGGVAGVDLSGVGFGLFLNQASKLGIFIRVVGFNASAGQGQRVMVGEQGIGDRVAVGHGAIRFENDQPQHKTR